jgi:hypothetical protein
MPDAKRTIVFYEGDDDKAFLEKLRDAGIWPAGWELARRDREHHAGKDGLVRQLLPAVSPKNGIGGQAVVLVDLDEMSPDGRTNWFRQCLADALGKFAGDVELRDGPAHGHVRCYELVSGERVGRVVVVPVGCPRDNRLTETYQVDRFAIDDWVLQLVLNQSVYEAVSDLKTVPYGMALSKLTEVGALFRKNGLEARKSKTYVQILRALAAIRPSTATIIGRLVEKGVEALGHDAFRQFIKPFLDDLDAAATLLASE